jgi:hypothetical protein
LESLGSFWGARDRRGLWRTQPNQPFPLLLLLLLLLAYLTTLAGWLGFFFFPMFSRLTLMRKQSCLCLPFHPRLLHPSHFYLSEYLDEGIDRERERKEGISHPLPHLSLSLSPSLSLPPASVQLICSTQPRHAVTKKILNTCAPGKYATIN